MKRQYADVLDRKCVSHLAIGIVNQALKDLRAAQRILATRPQDNMAEMRIEEICRFFRSEWYSTIRELAPETILENIMEVIRI